MRKNAAARVWKMEADEEKITTEIKHEQNPATKTTRTQTQQYELWNQIMQKAKHGLDRMNTRTKKKFGFFRGW
jgi:hypothetical protein